MSETTHTPGPWTMQPDETFSTLGDKRVVAFNDISPAIVFGGLGAETDANAHLIASAPELLEALEAAWERVHSDVCGRTCCKECENAKAAMAKARGE